MSIDRLLHKDEIWMDTRDTFLSKWSTTITMANDINIECIALRHILLKELESGEFSWGIPDKISINKAGTSKKRVVYLFGLRQRVVLGVLYRVLSEYFSSSVSDCCFSYKKGVSTMKAVEYIRSSNSENNMYGVKLDISAYFNSVGSERLQEMINILFKGQESTTVCRLLKELYSIDTVSERGVHKKEYMSLIPGTAVAAFFANYCLYGLDHHFEEKEVVYARYSDDILIFADTEDELGDHLGYVRTKLSEYGLSINPRKYEYFSPYDKIDFLGLTFDKSTVDLHRNSLEKMKTKIRKSCKKGRKAIEEGKPFDQVARSVIHSFNHRVYKCYIEDKSKYGWAFYAFRYINTSKSLREIDFYFRDRLRYMKTGRNNSANIRKTPNEELDRLGYVSMVMMYKLFKTDFDVYCDRVSLLL